MLRYGVLVSMSALLIAQEVRPLSSQATAKFDVVSVKASPDCRIQAPRGGISSRSLTLPCVSLKALIGLAYGDVLADGSLGSRRTEVLGGPNWLDTERYDVLAKVDGPAPPAQALTSMIQALIEERFQVKVHKEARDSAVYILSVTTPGHKLQPTVAGSCILVDLGNLQPQPVPSGQTKPKYCGLGQMRSSGSQVIADWVGVNMADLAGRMLPSFLDRPVVDRTGLAGQFDVYLEFVPDHGASGAVRLNGEVNAEVAATSADLGGPSIFVALEKQLGLKLSPGKAPVEVIVVDRAERPSAN